MSIPFNKPYMCGKELYYISQAHFNGMLAGDGPFTKLCHDWLISSTNCKTALLTHSCTAALELSALLADLQPGDEVIMPSYTFVSTANAFALRGATPVFVDIRPDTLNIDEALIEQAITDRTRVIVPVHYAGVGCEMNSIMEIAERHELMVVEDAAQGVGAKFMGRALGSIGHLGTFSFHETKNIISGEGGALLVNDDSFSTRAEILREKGTDRSQFFRGQVDKYTWQDIGSSYLPGELIAAFLWAQLEESETITTRRLAAWNYYHDLLSPLERDGLISRPSIPAHCEHNAHMYYVLLSDHIQRSSVIKYLNDAGVGAVFHYVPLHSSPAGLNVSRIHGSLDVTTDLSEKLVRLPMWIGLSKTQQEYTVDQLQKALAYAS